MLIQPHGDFRERSASTTTSSHGSSLTLAWDRNPEPDILGYHLYYGPSSCRNVPGCSYPLKVHVSANATCGEPDAVCQTFREGVLKDGQTHYFAVTAYSPTGESGFSNELQFSS